MIITKIKEINEIKDMLRGYTNILNVGCAGCTAVCLSGGQKEVDILNAGLKSSFKNENIKIGIDGYTVERQCEMDFVSELDHIIDKYDAVLSMACGAGVQFIAERYKNKPVFPSSNTTFIGVNRDVGWYEEKCRSCGDCQLAWTGGICPVTECAKSIFNGPCGGTRKGRCEVDENIPCAWNEIYERLKAQKRLDSIYKIKEPMKWRNQIKGSIILDAYKSRYVK